MTHIFNMTHIFMTVVLVAALFALAGLELVSAGPVATQTMLVYKPW